jgi:hypothetical protein
MSTCWSWNTPQLRVVARRVVRLVAAAVLRPRHPPLLLNHSPPPRLLLRQLLQPVARRVQSLQQR